MDIGNGSTGVGALNVVGVHAATSMRSTLDVTNDTRVGRSGNGTLNVNAGGNVLNSGDVYVGVNASGVGVVNIDGSDVASGNASSVAARNMAVGLNGKGALNLTNSGALNVAQVRVAANAGSVGTINVGRGALAGVLNAQSVTGGEGQATVNFDHTDDISFAPRLRGAMAVNKMGASTTLFASANDYAGPTIVFDGALGAGMVNAFSALSRHDVRAAATMSLNGFGQSVEGLVNAGTVRFGGDGGTVLDVAKDYSGNDGLLEFNTVLGDDNSVTDRLSIAGRSSCRASGCPASGAACSSTGRSARAVCARRGSAQT